LKSFGLSGLVKPPRRKKA